MDVHHSDTAQPIPGGRLVPAYGLFIAANYDAKATPIGITVYLGAGAALVARLLSADEARIIARNLNEIAGEIETAAAQHAADALAKIGGAK